MVIAEIIDEVAPGAIEAGVDFVSKEGSVVIDAVPGIASRIGSFASNAGSSIINFFSSTPGKVAAVVGAGAILAPPITRALGTSIENITSQFGLSPQKNYENQQGILRSQDQLLKDSKTANQNAIKASQSSVTKAKSGFNWAMLEIPLVIVGAGVGLYLLMGVKR